MVEPFLLFVFFLVIVAAVLFLSRKRVGKKMSGIRAGSRKEELRQIDLEVRKEIMRLKARKRRKKRVVGIDLLAGRKGKRRKKSI